eukprot:COSAG02_NODE_34258_length_487_cov_0.283505_1_plen_96_part_10
MSEAEAEVEAGADPRGAKAAPPGGAGFRFRDQLGFVRDESHPRWAAEEEEGGEEVGSEHAEGRGGEVAAGTTARQPRASLFSSRRRHTRYEFVTGV